MVKMSFNVQRSINVYRVVEYVMVHLRVGEMVHLGVREIVEMDQMNYIVMVSVIKSCHLSNQYKSYQIVSVSYTHLTLPTILLV